MNQTYGSHTHMQAWQVNSLKEGQAPFKNNLTRRNFNILQHMPSRSLSSSLASANIKSLRLFRNICRMLPFILKVHEVDYRFNHIQSKRYIANFFRANSTMTDLLAIDSKIQQGYEWAHQAEWHFCNTGYMYQFLAGPKKILNDHGKDKFNEQRGSNNKKELPSGFLKTFYNGKKLQTQTIVYP